MGLRASGPLAGKQIILTVSPVRHTGDTLAGNAVSKATLRLAAEQLTERFKCSAYFPAFEILTDDLRDYRFYADDLVHPAPQAVAYVWEKFAPAVLTDEALRLPTAPATRRARRTAPSAAVSWNGSPHFRRWIFSRKRPISADVSK